MERSAVVEVHVTCPTAEAAAILGRGVVESRIAACATVGGPVRSRFRWDGAVADDEAWSLAVKTRSDLAEAVADRLRAGHPCDLPAITVLDLRADADTVAWVAEVTAQPRGAE